MLNDSLQTTVLIFHSLITRDVYQPQSTYVMHVPTLAIAYLFIARDTTIGALRLQSTTRCGTAVKMRQ